MAKLRLSFIQKLVLKIFYFKSKIVINPFLNVPTYKNKFKIFNNFIIEKTSFTSGNFFNLRSHQIFHLLKKFNIKNVIEIGSGRTTFLFNSLDDLNVISYEQDLEWQKLMEEAFAICGIKKPQIEQRDIESYKNGGRLIGLDKLSCDLLYIDGPYLYKKNNKKFNTYTGKACFYDFETFFKNNIFPKLIMVDGRTDTVDEILKATKNKYKFIPETIFSIERNKLFSSLFLSRHSLFIRED